MKRLFNLIKRDMVLATRNKMVIYMLVVPVILAIGASFFIPSLNATQMGFVVDASIPGEFIDELRDYGKVEKTNGYDALEKRVLQPDDVPGITFREGQYQIVLQGNEDQAVKVLTETVIQYINTSHPLLTTEIKSMNVERSNVRDLLTIIILLNCVIMGGAVIGFTIVDEKENKGIEAVAVSPLTMKEYLLAKSIMALAYVIIASLICLFILQPANLNISGLLAVISVSALFGISFGFVVGAFAGNQVSAMALTKGLSFFAIAIPFVAWFVSESLQWLFYIFPNYWIFRLLKAVFVDQSQNYVMLFNITMVVNIIPILLLLTYMKRRLRLR